MTYSSVEQQGFMVGEIAPLGQLTVQEQTHDSLMSETQIRLSKLWSCEECKEPRVWRSYGEIGFVYEYNNEDREIFYRFDLQGDNENLEVLGKI